MPHTLEFAPDPHEVLREAARVLTGEGELVVLGFEPLGSWSLRNAFTRGGCPPGICRTISAMRLADWLKLVGFEVGPAQRYLYAPPTREPADRQGARTSSNASAGAPGRGSPGPISLHARKRVHSMTPVRLRKRMRTAVIGGAGGARRAARLLNRVEIYTDGACRGNPGAGGWGAVLRYRGRERELFGGEADTTNNRMELTAAIRALEALQRRCRVSHLHGLAVCARWHHDLVARLETPRLEDRRPQAGQEPDLWQQPRRARSGA